MTLPETALPAAVDFLSGGGEMGSRIHAFDWSAHPLGPPATWPQSLKTSVSIILNSRHPMWIGWGPQISFLYNDAYLHVLGLESIRGRWAGPLPKSGPRSGTFAGLWRKRFSARARPPSSTMSSSL